MRVSHRACPVCGRYNGRVAVDHTVKAKKAKTTVGNKSEVK